MCRRSKYQVKYGKVRYLMVFWGVAKPSQAKPSQAGGGRGSLPTDQVLFFSVV